MSEKTMKNSRQEELLKKLSDYVSFVKEKQEKTGEEYEVKEDEVRNFFKNISPKVKKEEMTWILNRLETDYPVKVNYLSEEEKDTAGLDLYLKEIGKIDLLTAEEEIELAKCIKNGEKAQEQIDLLTVSLNEYSVEEKTAIEEHIQKLEKDVEEGFSAKERMIKANLRLVVSIAKRYKGCGMILPELISAGNIGLDIAAGNFDYRRGNKFSTFATWKIRTEIEKAITNEGRTIRLPSNQLDNIYKLNKSSEKLKQKLGREPKPDDIAKDMGKTEEEVLNLQRIMQITESLDKMIDEDGRYPVYNNYDIGSPEDIFIKRYIKEEEQQLLDDILTERERDILFDDIVRTSAITEDQESNYQVEQNAYRELYDKLFGNASGKPMREEDFSGVSIVLDDRMYAAASLITPGNYVADLGRDHAYIPIFLCREWDRSNQKRGIESAIAMEINEIRRKETKSLIAKCGLSKRIETRNSGLFDGLEQLTEDYPDTVLITKSSSASIRTILNRKILEDYALPSSVWELVLQSEQDDEIAELRKCIRGRGFTIKDERMIREDGKFYPVIKAVRQAESGEVNSGENIAGSTEKDAEIPEVPLQDMEDAFGPILLKNKNPFLKLWLDQEKDMTINILSQLEKENVNVNEKVDHLLENARFNELSKKKELIEAALKFFNHEAF